LLIIYNLKWVKVIIEVVHVFILFFVLCIVCYAK